MSNYWIGVASKDHVDRGKKEGIIQVCHGKIEPLKRIKADDWIIYYSPHTIFEVKSPLRHFTGIAHILNKEPYEYQLTSDFKVWRRDVTFINSKEVAIEPLIAKLSFIKNKKNWGFIFRYGLLKIPQHDFLLIAAAMGVKIDYQEK